MGILNGTLPLHRFLVLGPVPSEDDLVQALQDDRFRPFEDGTEDSRHGWMDWRNPLETVDAARCCSDGIASFCLRVDKRRIPASTLKAHVEQRIQTMMKEKGLAFISKEARISIADEVKAELLPKVLPSMKVTSLAWRLKEGVLWADGKPDSLVGLFMKSFGCELQPLCPLLLAGRVVPDLPVESLMALDPLELEVTEA